MIGHRGEQFDVSHMYPRALFNNLSYNDTISEGWKYQSFEMERCSQNILSKHCRNKQITSKWQNVKIDHERSQN